MLHPGPIAVDDHRGKWSALIAAFLGWMFDGFEMGMFPLVGPNALKELLSAESTAGAAASTQWFGVIMAVFLVGAATGGVFFGWLGDRIGRVRAMSLSIFTYAIFTGLCAFATQAWHIAALRFIASLGMGGEWALGVALVTEIWPDKSRTYLAGLIGAASNVGFLLVGLLSLVLLKFIQGAGDLLLGLGVPEDFVAKLLRGEGWRLLMIAGALPALLIFFIRLCVPESRRWVAANERGQASHWATRDLIGVLIGACAALGMVVLWSPIVGGSVPAAIPGWLTAVRVAGTVVGFTITLAGFMYPVVRYLGRSEAAGHLEPGRRGTYLRRMLLGACLAGVPLLGTWGSLQWAPKWAIAVAKFSPEAPGALYAKELTQIATAGGAIFGTILAALAAGRFGRRITYFILCIGSFASLVYMYRGNDVFGAQLLTSAFVAGGVTAAFYGWFPLYFPEIFSTSIRATSQGFAYNFGRVLSAVGSLQTAVLTAYFAQGLALERRDVDGLASAGATLAGIYLVGLLIIWLGPETRGKPLPD
jgi:MFS transporter, SHS family, sialic acid transporter